MDDKQLAPAQQPDKQYTADEKSWVDDMKQELEDYLEEQGIYIRQ